MSFVSIEKAEFLLAIAILVLSCLLAFFSRLFAVVRFESVIHEFDPYFNFRSTQYFVSEGFYSFHNWFDERAWYPLGRIIGGTIYPGEILQLLAQTPRRFPPSSPSFLSLFSFPHAHASCCAQA
eukprot:m.448023 g.448023  ORF g.448023 m.448023 type:complete len:124 (-) comp56885_c0_seq9:1211-1582(-)